MNPISLPTHARVVVVGGGVIGTSVAYHLALMGWKDIVLLERDTPEDVIDSVLADELNLLEQALAA